jgi:transposase
LRKKDPQKRGKASRERPPERLKTDRRDSQTLAVQHHSGDLTAVWVPDPVHEAMRDLVCARMDSVMQLRREILDFCTVRADSRPGYAVTVTRRVGDRAIEGTDAFISQIDRFETLG